MIWILVPIFLFLCVLALIYYVKWRSDHQISWAGKISDLDMICHVLMSARLRDRSIDISSSKSDLVIRVNLTELSPSMQFLERSGIDDKAEVLHGAQMASARPVVAAMSDTGEIPPTSKDVAKVLKGIFRENFGTARQAKPHFTVRGHRWDLRIIEGFAAGYLVRDKELEVSAPTANLTEEWFRERRADMISLWSILLLGPIPFVVCYYLWDLRAAAVAGVVMFILFKAARYLRKGNFGDNWFWAIVSFLLPVMAAATVFTDDTWYLLKSISFLCLILIAAIFSFWVRKKTMFDTLARHSRYSIPRMLAVGSDVCLVALLFAAVYLNETLAARESLEIWVWYFAYLRVELLVGVIVTMMPLGLIAVFNGQLDD